jgi:sugar (pentulose or hexulose) kinase
MDHNTICTEIAKGNTALGIEFGSTRIKAVLINSDNKPIATGSHTWKSKFENGIWTYSEDAIWNGIQDCYANLAKNVLERYGQILTTVGAIGISAMMHGYMPFNEDGVLLTPFRSWQNTITGQAAAELTELFDFNIPQRWSVAHLYQAILNKEDHVKDISFLTTLEGYVHWRLTGEKVLGIGEASGMFPIDVDTGSYHSEMLKHFNAKTSEMPWSIIDLLPAICMAGENAGKLTAEGAKLLDPSGNLRPGIPFCPPEGDAETGMVATNSIAVGTGNISAGTSLFSMIVLERPLSKVYPEVDIVATPTGKLTAMNHCSNCTADMNAWVSMFSELCELMGNPVDTNTLYERLYKVALEGEIDCGGLLYYNYLTSERISRVDKGLPLFVRDPNSTLSLANFMRTQIYSAIVSLRVSMDLLKDENIRIDRLTGHGGLFKTEGVGQRFMAAALNQPISVMDTAEEGGAWGMALLASYMLNKQESETLDEFLNNKVFDGMGRAEVKPDPVEVSGFNIYRERILKGLELERCAGKCIL